MANPVTLVQGASRGLGLSFVRILANRSTNVIATCRNPSQAEELQRCLLLTLYRENTIQCSKSFHLKWFYDASFPSNALMYRHSFKYYVALKFSNVRHFPCRKQVLQLSDFAFAFI